MPQHWHVLDPHLRRRAAAGEPGRAGRRQTAAAAPAAGHRARARAPSRSARRVAAGAMTWEIARKVPLRHLRPPPFGVRFFNWRWAAHPTPNTISVAESLKMPQEAHPPLLKK